MFVLLLYSRMFSFTLREVQFTSTGLLKLQHLSSSPSPNKVRKRVQIIPYLHPVPNGSRLELSIYDITSSLNQINTVSFKHSVWLNNLLSASHTKQFIVFLALTPSTRALLCCKHFCAYCYALSFGVSHY